MFTLPITLGEHMFLATMKHSSKLLLTSCVLAAVVLVSCAPKSLPPPATTAPSSEAASSAMAKKPMPSDGWTLHIDARKHFSNDFDRDPIAHHYCKPVAGGLTECQLYDSDNSDARLVGVETIISAAAYNALPQEEKKFWHYHKTEIAKVDAKLPDLSAEEAAKVAKSIEETYGKIFIFWNPSETDVPTGQPHVTVVD